MIIILHFNYFVSSRISLFPPKKIKNRECSVKVQFQILFKCYLRWIYC